MYIAKKEKNELRLRAVALSCSAMLYDLDSLSNHKNFLNAFEDFEKFIDQIWFMIEMGGVEDVKEILAEFVD